MSLPLHTSPSDSDLVGLEAVPLSDGSSSGQSSTAASALTSPEMDVRTVTPVEAVGGPSDQVGSAPPSPGRQERRDAVLAQLLARGVDFDTAQTALACTGGDSLDAALAFLTEQQLALGGPPATSTAEIPSAPQPDAPSTLTEIPIPEPAPPSPPLPRRIKSILKTSPNGSNPNNSPFFAFQQNSSNGNTSSGVFSSAFAAASSTLGSKTSEWLKRNLSIDVQVAAANLSTSIRNLLPPTSPPGLEEMDAALGHLPVNFDPTLASAKDIPAVWLTVAADQDSRIPPLSSSCVLYDAVDRRWTRHLLRRQRLAKERRLKSGRNSPPTVVSNAYAPTSSTAATTPESTPAPSISAAPTTSSSSNYSPVRTTADSDNDDHPLYGADDDDSSCDSEVGAKGRTDPYDPLLPGYSNTKRVRFVLPADSLASSPPMRNGVVTTPTTHPRTVAPTDHPLNGTEMVVVEPEVMGAAKGLYSAREVVQAYVAACTDRRTRPLKAVMDAFLPHLQAAAGMAGSSRSAAVTMTGSTTPASLVIENMHLRRQDLIALGSVLELEFGLLDLRLTNVSLTNDLARYLLALLYRVDSCPSLSLADNPDLMRPMPVPGSLAPYLEQERHRQQLAQQQQQEQQRLQQQQQQQQQQQASQPQQSGAAAVPDPVPAMAVGPTASFTAITNTIRRRSSMASFSGLFSGNSTAASPASSAPSTPTTPQTPQPTPVTAPTLPSLDQLPFPPLLAPFPSTIAAYIQRSVALRSLDLSGIPLGSGWADLRPLARALRDGPDGLGATLQILTLDRCKLTTAALSQLCPAIRQSNLSSVSLRSNCIDPMGAAAIAGMLIPSTDPDARLTARYDPLWRDVVMGKRPRGVVVLDLSDNSIKSGVKVLGEALAKCVHVKHLLLGNNAIQGGSFAAFCRSMFFSLC
ncbi:hypothetical protein BCR44DRAFT_1060927 [Catenaria anguillulae PL171]|uniref:UBA domain-containing protein n=1 Tax=Catenaria anguillulae PL171 TaxID=765915 RepID=A0A1Y2HQF0_9FUNG|nr:hypothetical protein BCR44DRAFT_1060927 [Catenaria anguillulae PL171]